MAVANKYDTTMLAETVPGYKALNDFKYYTLYGKDGMPGVTGLDVDEAERISGSTSNPYARTIEDQERWDDLLTHLLANGHEGRDLFFKSRNELLILFWDCAPINTEEHNAWQRSCAHG